MSKTRAHAVQVVMVATKQSAKKKQKKGLNYRNAEVRTALDSQAQEIYRVRTGDISHFTLPRYKLFFSR